jgi:S1-C subfamily serine protease
MDMKEQFGDALDEVMQKFEECTPQASETMKLNFMTKLAFWMDKTMYTVIKEWNPQKACRVVYSGILKKQEYLFCYFLAQLGMGVMILAPEGVSMLDGRLEGLSKHINLGKPSHIKIPEYNKEQQHGTLALQAARNTTGTASTKTERQELSYEQLATLASSVVMIMIHDKDGQPIGTGSGIMISEKGYILTNCHVAAGGHFYSIRIEDDEKVYQTDEMIKYHQVLDLAVIRIDRQLKPLQLYRGDKPLVRGQKVVAIGSPMGLFNTVSDGIISGFRVMNGVDMIQFTAPTSHGSSGGAVLNMYGEVIGISTAGIDNGQNLNLAVGYNSIVDFIRGFL